MHNYFYENEKKYGPIYKMKMGYSLEGVIISDPKDIEWLMKNDGKYPARTRFEPWIEYRKMRGKPLGILLRLSSKLY